MNKEFLTIVEVANLLGLHVKTVRNYVRDGRLKSTRFGKQYRIARSDLDAFTGGVTSSSGRPRGPVSIGSSAIVEIDGLNPEAASRISNALTGAAKGRDEDNPLRIDAIYYEEQARLKVVIIGSIESTTILLNMIEFLAKE